MIDLMDEQSLTELREIFLLVHKRRYELKWRLVSPRWVYSSKSEAFHAAEMRAYNDATFEYDVVCYDLWLPEELQNEPGVMKVVEPDEVPIKVPKSKKKVIIVGAVPPPRKTEPLKKGRKVKEV